MRRPHILKRFGRSQSGWGFGGSRADAVSFKVDKPVWLTGLWVYGDKAGGSTFRGRTPGEVGAIHATVEGFQQALDVRKTPDNPVPDITHSTRLILVDARGVLRGYYETDPENLSALWADAVWLSQNPDQ